jgi:hypothetical protein
MATESALNFNGSGGSMWGEIGSAFLRRGLPELLAATIVLSSSAEPGPTAETKEYRNVDYAYAVTLPGGVRYKMNRAPNPNHGFRINVGSSASVWVDGSYTDDETLTQTAASERRSWGKGCTGTSGEPKTLDGVDAVQITLNCLGAAGGGRGRSTVTLLMALASPQNRSRIRYEIGMEVPSDAAVRSDAERTFKAVESGFHFIHE